VATDRVRERRGVGVRNGQGPVPLREVFDVSAQQHKSPVGSVPCRTRPALRLGRVGHDAHRHPSRWPAVHKRHGVNVQVVTHPVGDITW